MKSYVQSVQPIMMHFKTSIKINSNCHSFQILSSQLGTQLNMVHIKHFNKCVENVKINTC